MALSCIKKIISINKRNNINNDNFNCLNYLHSFRTKSKRESHKKLCQNKDFCNVVMPSEDTKLSQSNQYQKSDKALFFIYADLECLIEMTDECKNNP